jgi:signal transduction histidine kinase/CheY-like chemotaxis protein
MVQFNKRLAVRLLAAFTVSTAAIALIGAALAANVFGRGVEARQLEALDAYMSERAVRANTLFDSIHEAHQIAMAAFRARLDATADIDVAARFDALFPADPDGIRRSRDDLFDGGLDAAGDWRSGVGAFLAPDPDRDAARRRILTAAYDVVDRGGEMHAARISSLYFFTDRNELIISAPRREDRLQFYRREAGLDFDFREASFVQLVRPENIQDRIFVCDELSQILYVQSREALTTGCFTPVVLDGVHVGGFGTTIRLADYFDQAIANTPDGGENLFLDGNGRLIAHADLLAGGDITSEQVEALETSVDAAAIHAAINADGRESGALIAPDGRHVIAFANLHGAGWRLVSLVDLSGLRAESQSQVMGILGFALVAVLIQALLIYLVVYRDILGPLHALRRRFGMEAAPASHVQGLDRTLAAPHEIGDLARALDDHRRESDSLLADLETRVAERTRELEQANEAKGAFLANMSHELRTPLNAIIGLAWVLEDGQPDEDGREQVRMIRNSGETLTAILNDVLDMSKIEAGKLELDPQWARLDTLVRDVGELFRSDAELRGLDFRVEMECLDGLEACIDSLRIKQCLSNLVSNAVKFTNEGEVAIEARLTPVDDTQDRLDIIVRDSGVGIAPDALERLFTPFSQADNSITRNFGGTGLGLAITRRLAEMMGGDISVRSVEGDGSEFTLSLLAPVRRGDAENSDAGPDLAGLAMAEEYAPLKGARVLLVEDIATNRDVARRLLEPFEAEIAEAENGAIALQKLAAERFDIVLMDLQMPVMDGLEATRHIRASDESWADLPVLAVTANAGTDSERQCVEAGMNGRVCKPLHPRRLVDAIRDALAA